VKSFAKNALKSREKPALVYVGLHFLDCYDKTSVYPFYNGVGQSTESGALMTRNLSRTVLAIALVLFSLTAVAGEPEPQRLLLKRAVLEQVVITDYTDNSAKSLHPLTTVAVADGILTANFPPREDGPSIELWNGEKDLSKMDLLRFDVQNAGAARVEAKLILSCDAGHATFNLPLDPGANTVAYPIWWVVKDESAERLDISKLKNIRVTLPRQAQPAVLKFSKLTAQKVFSDASKLQLFTFNSTVAGAIPITLKSLYEGDKPYGIGGSEFGVQNWQGRFPLFGADIIGKDLTFTVNVPDGDYEVQTVAFGTSWQGVRSQSYRILAGDTALVDTKITPENFYTFEYQYYGANIFYDPTRPLFEQYHQKYFEPQRFETKAANGKLTLKFENCGVHTLWVYPKALADEGKAFVDCCYAEEAHNLWMNHARVREHEPTKDGVAADAKDQQRGFMLFSRNYQYRVYPNSLPTAAELIPNGLTVAAASNEFEPVTFVVRPLKDLGAVKVTVSELAAGEHKLPASVFEKSIVKYFPQSVGGIWYEPIPTMLYPYFDMELKKDWNCQYWLTLHVPAGTPAGDYKGTISVQSAIGAATEIPLTITVRPFDLPKSKTECGMWNNGAMSNHQIDAFPDDARATAVLEAECKNMSEHGLNCYAFDSPVAKAYDFATQSATLDFHTYDLKAAAVKKFGLTGRHKFGVDGLAKYGLLKHGFKEFSPEYNTALKQMMGDVRDWMARNSINGILQVTDEPRETDLEEWNFNRRDSIKLLKLAREVPGLKTMVTIMGDKDGFGRPYSPLVSLMDVMSTHSWPGSDNIIFLAAVEKIADYWCYNNGFTRFAHGWYLWKSKALGHWQWVYSWEVCNAHVPVFYEHDSSAIFVYPGGFLNTLKYENVREGIDDHRYLELLEDTIKSAAPNSPALKDAQTFLTVLEKFLPAYPDDIGQTTGAEAGGMYDESKATAYFDPWRAQVAEYIAALKENRAAKKVDAAWEMFPKQAIEEERRVICKLVAKGPVLDGKGSDPVWKDAPEVTDFVNLARAQLAPIQTHVKTVCDGEKLYFLFTCNEPKYGELKAYAINRDDACWEDDSIEIFLDTKHDKQTYKHICINCLGTIEDEDGRDSLWNGDIQTAVSKEKGLWRVELSVSLKSLGVDAAKEGGVWGVNLCRNRQPQPSETSSWAFVGHSFHNPSKFGTLEFKH
jgi:hypothetical protein